VALSGRRIRPRLGRGRPLHPQRGRTARAVSPHQWSRGCRPRPGLGSGRPRRPRRGLVVSGTLFNCSGLQQYHRLRGQPPGPPPAPVCGEAAKTVKPSLAVSNFTTCQTALHCGPSLSGATRTSGREPAFPGGDIMLLSESRELSFSQLLGLLLQSVTAVQRQRSPRLLVVPYCLSDTVVVFC